jgi:nitroreductase
MPEGWRLLAQGDHVNNARNEAWDQVMAQHETRVSEQPIDELFLRRWSPRAFNGETISETDLLTMLEAARWAPSSYNSQPWRFLYARRDTEHWTRFLDLLVPFNRSWAQSASALVIIVSNSLMKPPGAEKEVPSSTHSYDAGTASACFALQATMMGWAVHGMVGFDKDRAFAELDVPKGYKVEAAYAVGKRGDKTQLPEAMQAREAPNDRLPLSALAFEGRFPPVG